MLWTIRAVVDDRPGALALLAQECGKAEVNILRLWVHPPGEGSADGSTDDLVVDAPATLDRAALTSLVERAGANALAVERSEDALTAEPGDTQVDLVAADDGAVAVAAGVVVGRVQLLPPGDGEPDASRRVDLAVDPAWRRRGLGTRLLREAARTARARGVSEVVLDAPAASSSVVLSMVLAAGLRGRLRMSGERVTVRVGVTDR